MWDCSHICTSNCRRVGCNCECGEFHQEKANRVFDEDQLEIIEKLKEDNLEE